VVGRSYAAGDASNFDRFIIDSVYFSAKRFHAGKGRGTVSAGGEVGEAGDAFSKCGQHAVPVANGLVAGQTKASVDVASGANDAFFGLGGQEGSK
jgi:hypothetical protein